MFAAHELALLAMLEPSAMVGSEWRAHVVPDHSLALATRMVRRGFELLICPRLYATSDVALVGSRFLALIITGGRGSVRAANS